MSDLLVLSEPREHYNVAGTRILKYTIAMSHNGLHEHRHISAPEAYMLQNKADIQARKWAAKWSIVDSKRRHLAQKVANAGEAQNQTKEAEAALQAIENLLLHTLSIDDTISWDSLKTRDPFPERKPAQLTGPAYRGFPDKPNKDAAMFVPQFTLMEMLCRGLRNKKAAAYERIYAEAIAEWQKEVDETDNSNKQLRADYEVAVANRQARIAEWETRKADFLAKQDAHNARIDAMEKEYLSRNPVSIVEYCEMVLDNSEYPESFPKGFEVEFNPDNGILVVEYQLPNLESMPRVKEVKYIASKNELKQVCIPESQVAKIFDEAIYRIALRTVHELFEADAADALESVSFNGWVRAINKATGKEENNCILSLQVPKADFLQIDLQNVDPRVCFKSLKGVAGSKLSSLTPVRPILQIDKTDKRFVEAYAVADEIDDSTNLAAMDWEDFEHLIRELFEKEFQTSGGEVKVTRASRDGGVDAIAFDPDPIRGGKIVIQAKRYTNTVGVSAVRDLYGTVMNEGATKGILVSTANYGPDAYGFAKNKPLTLLSGSNLLHLLQKHGHRAKIDLREAKMILSEKGRQ